MGDFLVYERPTGEVERMMDESASRRGAAQMGRDMEALERERNKEMWAEFPDAPAPPSNAEQLSEMLDASYEAGFAHGYRKRAELNEATTPESEAPYQEGTPHRE